MARRADNDLVETAAATSSIARALALFRAGRLGAAEHVISTAFADHDAPADALALMGLIAYERGRFDLAEAWHRRALAAKPQEALYRCNLATPFVARGRLDEAIAIYLEVLRTEPAHLEAAAGLTDALEKKGNLDEAAELLATYLRANQITPRMAVIYGRILLRRGDDDAFFDFIREQLARSDVRGAARRSMLFMLGTALDRRGDVDGAFRAFAEANAIDSRPFDIETVRRKFDAITAVFSRDRLPSLPRSECADELPVFIVGMPRCGSTLIEQIIHAHSRGHGAGETTDLAAALRALPDLVAGGLPFPAGAANLTPPAVNELASTYLDRLRKYAPRARRIADKALENFQRLAMISLMLPAARVIHVRRHPMDLCLSCYMRDLPPQMHPYSTDLANLGLYYREYARLMDHWREAADLRMLEFDYEALVAEPEVQTRRLIDFLDLEWDERCLRFHEARRDVVTLSYDQVRRPIYRSASGRWQRYRHHLGPLIEALGDALPGGVE